MRLTIRTNLAMRTLMFCAINAGRTVRKSEIAENCNASENHLAQVINTLSQRGFIETRRGRAGGMQLARPAAEISVGEVFRSFEGGLPFAECFDEGSNTCPLRDGCMLRNALSKALEAFFAELDRYNLADLVENNDKLEKILLLPNAMPHVTACSPRISALH
ncbi:Rrf2 family transcriptional regulator [Thioclava sp. GXIMD4216]|uniref:Rrf2 family transcriptional regulator n=1 Tax=Thioclava litoralis TaxID=3076557 RepID=A0ABZ1DX68_9RHOB|nr:Rrf2 family transcriptional regulator [Thioclava sp. FTW29]